MPHQSPDQPGLYPDSEPNYPPDELDDELVDVDAAEDAVSAAPTPHPPSPPPPPTPPAPSAVFPPAPSVLDVLDRPAAPTPEHPRWRSPSPAPSAESLAETVRAWPSSRPSSPAPVLELEERKHERERERDRLSTPSRPSFPSYPSNPNLPPTRFELADLLPWMRRTSEHLAAAGEGERKQRKREDEDDPHPTISTAPPSSPPPTPPSQSAPLSERSPPMTPRTPRRVLPKDVMDIDVTPHQGPRVWGTDTGGGGDAEDMSHPPLGETLAPQVRWGDSGYEPKYQSPRARRTRPHRGQGQGQGHDAPRHTRSFKPYARPGPRRAHPLPARPHPLPIRPPSAPAAMRAPPMVPEYDPRAPWIPHPQQVQPGQIGGYPPNSHNNCGPPRGFNNKNNNRGNPYAGRDLETRLSDRYRPDTPWSVRERTILVGPVLNDVVAEQLAGVLIRRLGPVDSVRIADGVARVMFDYTHAELARRVLHNMVIDGHLLDFSIFIAIGSLLHRAVVLSFFALRLGTRLTALQLPEVGRDARADQNRRKQTRFREARRGPQRG